MSDYTQQGMTGNPEDTQSRVRIYQEIVQSYETLDSEIDQLIMQYGGASKNMPDDVMARYRVLARQRSELHNHMLLLARGLFGDDPA